MQWQRAIARFIGAKSPFSICPANQAGCKIWLMKIYWNIVHFECVCARPCIYKQTAFKMCFHATQSMLQGIFIAILIDWEVNFFVCSVRSVP